MFPSFRKDFSWLIMCWGGGVTLATNTCAISVDITAPDDKSPWYDLWQAAVALDGMCARAGRTGKFRLIGEGRQIGLLRSVSWLMGMVQELIGGLSWRSRGRNWS